MHLSWQKIADENPSATMHTFLLYSLVESTYVKNSVNYQKILGFEALFLDL